MSELRQGPREGGRILRLGAERVAAVEADPHRGVARELVDHVLVDVDPDLCADLSLGPLEVAEAAGADRLRGALGEDRHLV